MRVVLTDIEGTTSPITFVREVLFPYARARLPAVVHDAAERWAPLWEEVRRLAGEPTADQGRVLQHLLGWMDEDRKVTVLKELQGRLWEEGYQKGELRAPLYPDVLPALRRWRAAGVPVFVYSSGSVKAQQLFFGYTEAGDLSDLFSGWFDTRMGSKLESESYLAITRAIGVEAPAVCFLSDARGEVDAAAKAGLDTAWVVREGQLPVDDDHRVVRSFEGL